MENPALAEALLCTPEALAALPALTAPLLRWYRKNKRALPWRENPTPYRVWVSEVMLQQTRVEAVRGYYARFLDALPSVAALAACEEERLLKLWEGLGYYSRARNLKKAAEAVMREHGGALPASYAALHELPGFGEYTAGAVASIAFGVAVPAVDGNVYRVLSRLLASYADTSVPKSRKAFREAAFLLLPERSPGDLNQALMELGATVCLPRSPACLGCPVREGCAGFREGCAAELPVKAAKKARRVEQRTVVLAVSPQGILLWRRGEAGLLAGMYEPLNLEGHLAEEDARSALASLGGQVQRLRPLGAAKHIFSHVEWHMQGYLAAVPPFPVPEGAVWGDRAALAGTYAVPSAFKAYFKEDEIGAHFAYGEDADGTAG